MIVGVTKCKTAVTRARTQCTILQAKSVTMKAVMITLGQGIMIMLFKLKKAAIVFYFIIKAYILPECSAPAAKRLLKQR